MELAAQSADSGGESAASRLSPPTPWLSIQNWECEAAAVDSGHSAASAASADPVPSTRRQELRPNQLGGYKSSEHRIVPV
jgi:hypothetical protein